jgi:hypothetical protein
VVISISILERYTILERYKLFEKHENFEIHFRERFHPLTTYLSGKIKISKSIKKMNQEDESRR